MWRTDVRTYGRTDRREVWNSYLDEVLKFNRSPSIKTFKELYSVFGRRRHVVTFASLIPELPNELFSCRYCSWNLLCFLFHELGESRFSIFFKEGNENTKYIHYILHKFSKFKWCIITEFMLGNFRIIIGEEICILFTCHIFKDISRRLY